MSWQDEIDELRRREELARRMGGPDKVKRQHDGGKLTVRERIDRLLDAGSFHEIGALTGVARYGADGTTIEEFIPANLVTGRGRIDGRPVVVAGDDFTVRGGANDAGIKGKLLQCERMARDLRLPMVRLVDGTGGGGSVKNLEMLGYSPMPKAFLWDTWTDNLGEVPVVSLALGSVAGLGSARVVASHYSVMVKDSSQLFVAGPPVVARTHRQFDKNELGGSQIHTRNGAVDDEAASEDEAFARARRFLSYLPSSVYELAAAYSVATTIPAGASEWLIEAVPRDPKKVYPMRRIVEALVDKGSFFEMGRNWGRPIITGLARLSRLAGGADGGRPDALRRRLDREGLGEDHPLRRPGADLSSAGGAPGRRARLPDRPRRRARRDHTLWHARRERGAASRPCLGARCWCARSSAWRARCTRTPRATACATPGLRPSGARCRSRADWKRRTRARSRLHRTPRRSGPRSRRASSRFGSPLRSAENVRRRGDHRPARHPAAAVRVRRARGAAARARPGALRGKAIIPSILRH